MRLKTSKWLGLSILFLGVTARAGLLEIRAGVGMNAADPKDLNTAINSGLDSNSIDNYNLDVYVNLPALPIGVGLRNEWLKGEASFGADAWDIDANNLTVLVDWRIIDSVIYVGPLVTIGAPFGDILANSGGNSDKATLKMDQLSYGIAAEAGIKIGSLILGAEAGYQSVKLKAGSGSSQVDVDLSGVYGKAMVGISFF